MSPSVDEEKAYGTAGVDVQGELSFSSLPCPPPSFRARTSQKPGHRTTVLRLAFLVLKIAAPLLCVDASLSPSSLADFLLLSRSRYFRSFVPSFFPSVAETYSQEDKNLSLLDKMKIKSDWLEEKMVRRSLVREDCRRSKGKEGVEQGDAWV